MSREKTKEGLTNEKIFNPSEAHKLADPARLSWLPPSEVLARLRLRSGMNVADIGAASVREAARIGTVPLVAQKQGSFL